jgi:hypothetical protein
MIVFVMGRSKPFHPLDHSKLAIFRAATCSRDNSRGVQWSGGGRERRALASDELVGESQLDQVSAIIEKLRS